MTLLQPGAWDRFIRPGSRVFVGTGAACPHALLRSLLGAAATLRDIELVTGHTLGPTPWLNPAVSEAFSVNSFVHSPALQDAVQAGRADHTPCFFSEIPALFIEGVLPLDVALVHVSPPDAQGYCSFGVGVDLVVAACRAARFVIAQINPRMPRTHGPNFLHRDHIDAFVDVNEELPELPASAGRPEFGTIGRYVAQLIADGSTLRLGVGPLPEAVLAALTGHHDLGLHSEVLGDGVLPLLTSGVINNRRKTLHPGKTIAGQCLGTRRLYDFVHDNPHVELHPTEYVNNPLVIARHDHMVSVTSALEVDLSGQVVGSALGRGFASVTGGQIDFIRGAAMSREGRPIIALPSATPDGSATNILPQLREGASGVTSRGDVHYVVTEYGIATLRGRSMRERALELIQVAHPKFRDELREAAVSRGWLPSYQRSSPQPVPDLGDLEAQRLDLPGAARILRPLHPSDIRRLQEFFYSHTLETIQMRYGHVVTRMPRERAYDLVNVDQSRDLALAIFETQGPRQVIHAVGRYYLDPDGRTAEVAFVVRESQRRSGLASILLRTLLDVAGKRGLDALWGRVRRDNLPMLALFRRFGGQPQAGSDGDGTDIDMRLSLHPSDTPPAKPPKKRPRAARSPKKPTP